MNMHRLSILLILIIALGGCGPKKETNLAEAATAAGRWSEAYDLWSEVLEEDPGDVKAKLQKERARINAALYHLRRAEGYYLDNLYNEALFELNLTLGYDPFNAEAKRMARDAKNKRDLTDARARGEEERSKKRDATMPQLRPSTWAPQNLSFRNKSLPDIYMSLGRAYGINIVLDKQIRDTKVTVDLRNLTFLKALDTLMVVNRHFFKVIDNNTIIIMEDNPTTRKAYDNQIIRTFYLSNVTPSDLKPHIRQLSEIKTFAENERLNSITIKGTPEQVALMEKIIRDNDKAQPEVVVQIELLEVNKNKMRKVGIQPIDNFGSPTYRAGLIADPVGRSNDDADAGGIRGIFPSLDEEDFLTLVPNLAVDFLKESGDSNQVANPHLRVTSGEEGTVRIGQSIPVVNTSFTNANISGSTSGSQSFGDQALTTFNYQEVGIFISVTPRVHYNDEVTLELKMEVSSVLSAGLQPIFGKREVTTSLRLRDGEMNVLAGLLTEEERKSIAGIIGLMDIPVLGKLFTNDEKIISKTDIVMTVRPVIIRGTDVTDEDRAPYEVSTLRLSSLYGEEAAQQESMAPAPTRQPMPYDNQPQEQDQSVYRAPEPDTPRRETVNRTSPYVTPIYKNQPADPEPEPEPEPEVYEPEPDEGEEMMEIPPAMLAFTPNSQEARVDDLVEYTLFLTNVDALSKGEVTLTFDPNVLQVETVAAGDFFNSQGRKPHLTSAWNNQNGTISMIVTQRMGLEPFSGSGIMALVRFKAVGNGDGELGFRNPKLTTPEGADIPLDVLTGRYQVYP